MSFPFIQRYRKTPRKARYKTKKPPISWWLSVRHAGIEPASMDLESMAHPSIPMAHKKKGTENKYQGLEPYLRPKDVVLPIKLSRMLCVCR